ncbi:MAG: type II secretion system protein [Candidatus Acidiferrales bacterium]
MKRAAQSLMNHNDRNPERSAHLLRRAQAAGFTLLEMLIVIMIILILAGIATGRYEKSVLRAKEATLKQDLFVMRQAIQQYTLDKQAAPTSLDDLVTAKYMSSIPIDPITKNRDWKVDFEDVLLSPEQTSAGLTDVHSSSDAVSPFENTPYSSW